MAKLLKLDVGTYQYYLRRFEEMKPSLRGVIAPAHTIHHDGHSEYSHRPAAAEHVGKPMARERWDIVAAAFRSGLPAAER